ncbi:aminodeoxychorismate lyase, partial [Bacillus sp. JJ1764]|uniref:aminodeoxychorismate lyase n=1 Tax=Bacillus sp. JJ1764 TaxID=3122964 RepID=UPI002FFFD046
MKHNLLTSFAAGILLSTSITGAVYFFGDHDTTKESVKTSESQTKVQAQPTEEDMKNKLVSAGYIVQTKADYDKKIEETKAAAQKSSGNQAANVSQVVISVTDGMTSIDVGRILVTAKIIPDAYNFSKDIENRGLSNKLRPGIYVIDNKMPLDQIIN